MVSYSKAYTVFQVFGEKELTCLSPGQDRRHQSFTVVDTKQTKTLQELLFILFSVTCPCVCNIKLWNGSGTHYFELTSYDVDLVLNNSSRSANVFHRPRLEPGPQVARDVIHLLTHHKKQQTALIRECSSMSTCATSSCFLPLIFHFLPANTNSKLNSRPCLCLCGKWLKSKWEVVSTWISLTGFCMASSPPKT